MQSNINKEPHKGPESNLSVKTAFGFCPQSTRCSPNPIFYRSKQPSASIRKAPGAHRTLFFIGQNSLRLLSARHPVLAKPYFLLVKTAFGFCPQGARWGETLAGTKKILFGTFLQSKINKEPTKGARIQFGSMVLERVRP